MLRRAIFTCALLAALAGSGCSGGEDAAAEDPVLVKSSFKEVVTSELKKARLDAEQGFGLKVRVREELNWIDLVLDGPFAEYRKSPERRDEVLARLVEEAERRLGERLGATSFAEVRKDLMPVLKPRFALRGLEEEPAQTRIVANLAVIYAVEREHDFTVVSSADVERWAKPVGELHRLALANLFRQTNREQELLCEPSGGSQLCGWASGDGYDATRMIVPGLRRQIEREYDGPAIYAVPTEDVFVALPLGLATRKNTERLLRTKLKRDFTTSENPVSPELFVERRGMLVLHEG